MNASASKNSLAIVPFMIAMAIIVALSNKLVQYPVALQLGNIDLKEILTWGAFTYPVAFFGYRSCKPQIRPFSGPTGRGGWFCTRRCAQLLARNTAHCHRFWLRLFDSSIAGCFSF